ncbi:hypothetical protein EXIGLDRAFT_361150 [Exidia glandulosa HHB12029]|uniref:F-box domain-containing protein n=1 Tax=Exidia glandulosa HHB12029 TaxID=1314781 RepID=A0A165C5V0_EXIGL|nr:hypothetical protein EXIGLDRAFT_361150 [Exidia glandulosa HHB12029]
MSLVLPDTLMRELDAYVRRVAKHVQDTQDQSKLDELRYSLSRQVAVIVSDVIAARNIQHARSTALAPELWCMIWCELPFASRIHVSHVCRSWRAMALAIPRLWNDVKIVYSDDDAQLQALGPLLQRSASTPVRLHLAALAKGPLGDKLVHINTQLAAHASHIRALRVHVLMNSDLLPALRDVLPTMSSLQHARFEMGDFDAVGDTMADPGIGLARILHLDGGRALGALRVLELDGFLFNQQIPVDLIHVEEVSLHYRYGARPLTPARLNNLLASCPRMKKLHLDLQAGWSNEPVCKLPEDLALELDTVTLEVDDVGSMQDNGGAGVLEYLRSESRRVVAFRFRYDVLRQGEEGYGYGSADVLDWRFAELVGGGPLHVVVGRHGRRGSGIRISDSEGRVREVVSLWETISHDRISSLFAKLAPMIRSLVTDTSAPFQSNQPFPAMSRLTLRFARPSDLIAFGHPEPSTMPALHTLRVELVDAATRAPCRANGNHRVEVESVLALLPRDEDLDVLQLAQVGFCEGDDHSGLAQLRGRVGAIERTVFDERLEDVVGQLGPRNLWSD